MRPKLLIATAPLLLAIQAWGAGAGTTGADFLNIGVGPRATAMGDAQTAVADDAYATHWNPAGLAQLQTPEAAFTQTQYINDVTSQYLVYAHPTQRVGTFAGSLNYFSVGKVQGYDDGGERTGMVGASDLCSSLSYAYPFYQDRRYGTLIAAGASTKWIRETLDTVSANAFAADAGFLIQPGKTWGDFWDGWRGGISIRNIGSRMRFDSEPFALPRTAAAGASYSGRLANQRFTIALDGMQTAGAGRAFGAGLEVWTTQLVVLRAGYRSNVDLGSGLRLGGGLRFKSLAVDYAFVGVGAFGSVHRFGVSFLFGKKPANPLALAHSAYERGMRDFRDARYSDALVNFNKALEVDPSHPEALRMMDKTYEKLKEATPE